MLLRTGNVNAEMSFEMCIEYDWGESGVEIRGYNYIVHIISYNTSLPEQILSFALLE